MIKRTIEISSAPAHLTTRHDQLVLTRDGEVVGAVPCEDLGVVIVDHPQTTYSHSALTSLLACDAVLVVCDRAHLPAGILLPLSDHTQVVWRIEQQIAVGKPLRKRLWKQLIEAKIRAQGANLAPNSPGQRRLLQFAREVRSGDPTNREAQASRIYWSAWLVNGAASDGEPENAFRRHAEGIEPNALLNYGYAIVRAALARALVAAGILPAIGLHHSNRSNAFCLADDLLEPLRPLVDARVRELYWSGRRELDRPAKAALLGILADDVATGEQTGPLLVALQRMVASLVKCYEGAASQLEIPVACK